MPHTTGKNYKSRPGHKNPKKVGKVMHEFKKGTLKSSSGKKVVKRKQAIAIGLSEAGLSRKNPIGSRLQKENKRYI